MRYLGVYSFYDSEAGVYTTPFFAKDDMFAKRHWYLQLDEEKSMLKKFVEMYELVRVATFDTEEGEFLKADIENEAEAYVVLSGRNIPKEYIGGNENGET